MSPEVHLSLLFGSDDGGVESGSIETHTCRERKNTRRCAHIKGAGSEQRAEDTETQAGGSRA